MNTDSTPLPGFRVTTAGRGVCQFLRIAGEGRQIAELNATYARKINDALELVEQIASLTTSEDEFDDLKAEHGANEDGSVTVDEDTVYETHHDLISEMSDERLCGEYSALVSLIEAARYIVGKPTAAEGEPT